MCSRLSDKGVEVREGGKCVQCHGNPPDDAAHLKHAAAHACTECHPGSLSDGEYKAPATHQNNLTDVILKIGTYSAAGKSCQSTACHGNGSAVSWDQGPLGCGACHAVPPATRLHAAHAAYECDECHLGYSVTAADTVKSPLTHLNGVVEVNGPLSGGTANSAGLTCAGVYCHGAGHADTMSVAWNSGTVGWDDTLDCNGCHNTANHMVAELGFPGTTCWSCHTPQFHADSGQGGSASCGACHAVPPGTGGHAAHASYGCGLCHTGYTDSTAAPTGHINGIKEVAADLAGGAYNTADSTCANVWCHGAFSGGNNGMPSWFGPAVACGACHDIPPSRGAHARHTGTSRFSNNFACNTCHAGYTDTTVAPATHVDLVKNVNGLSTGAFSSATGVCSGVYCHGQFTGGTGADPNWLTTSVACGACHPQPPRTGEHEEHVIDRGYDCSTCHGAGYSRNASVVKATHVNGAKNIALVQGSYANRQCSGTGCHGTETW
jgi:predicted CxxxxCH...CXXCH cytochrome family protein